MNKTLRKYSNFKNYCKNYISWKCDLYLALNSGRLFCFVQLSNSWVLPRQRSLEKFFGNAFRRKQNNLTARRPSLPLRVRDRSSRSSSGNICLGPGPEITRSDPDRTWRSFAAFLRIAQDADVDVLQCYDYRFFSALKKSPATRYKFEKFWFSILLAFLTF